MTNPTRQEIIEAHEALKNLEHLAWKNSEDWDDENFAFQWQQRVLKALPPKPHPTMAEVEWDDKKHYLAEAESGMGVKVIMLSEHEDSIMCIQPPNAGGISIGFLRSDLTPTGRRCKLVLDDDHPEYMETEQDYENAPEGTVAAAPGEFPRVKDGTVWYAPDSIATTSHETMAGTRRRVLRWEWGEKK